MIDNVIVKEVPIEEAVKVHATVTEFDEQRGKEDFEKRYADKEHLITVAYIRGKPIGYMISYDRDGDGSFYCWMAGVNPKYRRRGALKALMSYLENWLKAHGYSKIAIKTRNNRRSMLVYLMKHGFFLVGVNPRDTVEENRIMLEKPL